MANNVCWTERLSCSANVDSSASVMHARVSAYFTSDIAYFHSAVARVPNRRSCVSFSVVNLSLMYPANPDFAVFRIAMLAKPEDTEGIPPREYVTLTVSIAGPD